MKGTAVAIGTFDGVHRGHQAILVEAARLAEEHHLESVAYAFDDPPRSLVAETAPSLLLPPDAKRRLLASWVDRVEAASFQAVRHLEPADFVDRILLGALACRWVVVGTTFRFGRGRRGHPAWLTEYGAARQVSVCVLPPTEIGGAPVSSTRIRAALRAGHVEEAAELLGRPPLLFGIVESGDRIGRTLGFPTANLAVDPRIVLPAAGVYLAHAFGDVAPCHALVYVGTRPTLSGTALRCEAHLLEPPARELYGSSLEVSLLRKIRGDRKFADLAALRAQMTDDRDAARRLADAFPVPASPPAG